MVETSSPTADSKARQRAQFSGCPRKDDPFVFDFPIPIGGVLLVGSDVEGCDFDFVGVIAGGGANEFESFAGVDDVVDDEEAFGMDVQGVEGSCFFDELRPDSRRMLSPS